MTVATVIGLIIGIGFGLFALCKVEKYQMSHGKITFKNIMKSIEIPLIIGLLFMLICDYLPTGDPWSKDRFTRSIFFIPAMYCLLWWARNLFGFRVPYLKFPTKTLKEYAGI